MILIDEITNEKAHLIQMRVEDFGRMIAQHSESIDSARRILSEHREQNKSLLEERAKLREAHDKTTLGLAKEVEELRNALGTMLGIAKPKGPAEKEAVSAAQKLFDDTAPIPF